MFDAGVGTKGHVQEASLQQQLRALTDAAAVAMESGMLDRADELMKQAESARLALASLRARQHHTPHRQLAPAHASSSAPTTASLPASSGGARENIGGAGSSWTGSMELRPRGSGRPADGCCRSPGGSSGRTGARLDHRALQNGVVGPPVSQLSAAGSTGGGRAGVLRAFAKSCTVEVAASADAVFSYYTECWSGDSAASGASGVLPSTFRGSQQSRGAFVYTDVATPAWVSPGGPSRLVQEVVESDPAEALSSGTATGAGPQRAMLETLTSCDVDSRVMRYTITGPLGRSDIHQHCPVSNHADYLVGRFFFTCHLRVIMVTIGLWIGWGLLTCCESDSDACGTEQIRLPRRHFRGDTPRVECRDTDVDRDRCVCACPCACCVHGTMDTNFSLWHL
eukprot:COSAG01_NODE_8088_length_2925_cov_7.743100_1_plen_396_part_00